MITIAGQYIAFIAARLPKFKRNDTHMYQAPIVWSQYQAVRPIRAAAARWSIAGRAGIKHGEKEQRHSMDGVRRGE